MRTNYDMSKYENDPRIGAVTAKVRLLQSARRRSEDAGMFLASLPALFLLFTATLGGCATMNYDFEEVSNLSGSRRVERLTEDLVQEQEAGKNQELFDMKMVPLTHTHLSVFAESSEEEGIREGFVEADIDAYLPLFGVVNATVTRYDEGHRMSEHHEYRSYLWGIFQSHREKVDTRLGLRDTKMRRFLWFFGWRSSPEYTASNDEAPSWEEARSRRM